MAIPHAVPGVPMDLRSPEDQAADGTTSALVKTDVFEAIRLAIPAGHEVCRNHQVDGPITLHCLEGRIAFTADDDARAMTEGEWLYLPGGVPHTIVAEADSLLLLTIMFRR